MNTQQKIEVMQAYADGKQIQIKGASVNSEWGDWVKKSEPRWDWALNNYRIKPEEKKPTYRPYENTDEMIADYCYRFVGLSPDHVMPLIWVRSEETECTALCVRYLKKDVSTHNRTWDMDELFNQFTYLDGTPCGKLVEE